MKTTWYEIIAKFIAALLVPVWGPVWLFMKLWDNDWGPLWLVRKVYPLPAPQTRAKHYNHAYTETGNGGGERRFRILGYDPDKEAYWLDAPNAHAVNSMLYQPDPRVRIDAHLGKGIVSYYDKKGRHLGVVVNAHHTDNFNDFHFIPPEGSEEE